MTAPTTTLSDRDLALIERLHGHLCPMVLLGARTGQEAREILPADGTGAGLYGYFRGYGCAVDGIQIYSGCTWGNQNLVQLRGGDFSFLLTVEGAAEGVLVSPLPEVLDRVRGEKTPESRSALMELFTSAPGRDLFETSTVHGMGAISRFPGD